MAQRSFDKVKSLRIATLILIDILLINLSVLSCLLVVSCNFLSKRFGQDGLF